METKNKAILTLIEKLQNEGIYLHEILNISEKESEEYINGNRNFTEDEIKSILSFFENVTYEVISDESNIDEIVSNAKIRPIILKLRYLNKYLNENKDINLSNVLSISDDKLKNYLNGKEILTKRQVNYICRFFMLDSKYLLDDDLSLPIYEDLKVDEDLYKVLIEEQENSLRIYKHKHFMARNYQVLPLKKRIQLIVSTILITLPMLIYSIFCMTQVVEDKNNDIIKYKQGSENTIYDTYDDEQVTLHDKLQTTSKETNQDAYYCNVTIGTTLYRIFDISPDSSSFSVKMELYFYFDKDEFNSMFKHYAEDALYNEVSTCYESDTNDTFDTTISFSDWINSHSAYFDSWCLKHASEYYPGDNSSNLYMDKNSMFTIGNGSITANTISYITELEEIKQDTKTICYQKVELEASFVKSFDSVRYPLESVQFKMYIQPTLDANYIRYLPDYRTNSNGETYSGFSTYFNIAGGYRLINNTDDIKNLSLKLNYYEQVNNEPLLENYPTTIKTQLEIVVRANRSGISLFLKAFINLFSVIIWIIIAFYNQSYNGENSIGMLGTGLFGVISSMIVGLSLMSDSGIFSIITMINIFTLAVIMIMAYHSISQVRSQTKKDNIMISYNNVKLRILFVAIVICSIFMFVGIPCASYMFGL